MLTFPNPDSVSIRTRLLLALAIFTTEFIVCLSASAQSTAPVKAEVPASVSSNGDANIATPPVFDSEHLSITSVCISPDGKHLAVTVTRWGLSNLHLIDTASNAVKTLLVGHWAKEGFYKVNRHPLHVLWVTNDLLTVDYGYQAESINLNGKRVAIIGKRVLRKVMPDDPNSSMLWVLSDSKSNVLATADARTGKITKANLPSPGSPTSWAFDGSGALRAVTMKNSAFWKDATTLTNWYLPKSQDGWRKLAEFSITERTWNTLGASVDDDSLVIATNIGRDTRAVFSYDTKTLKIGDMLSGHPQEDIVSIGGSDPANFSYVTTNGLKPTKHWFDAAWTAVQQAADQALPNRFNIISGDAAALVLVQSFSDIDPSTWYLLDMRKRTLKKIGQRQPEVDRSKMLPMEGFRYAAKDGLSIPAYLTKPANAKAPAPLVVVIHGGPTVRDYWGFDTEVQFLAKHGFAVFQPQFRGSEGFGAKFMEAGFGQWGLAMQDDITAGVEYLIDKGIADPKRICIYGGSYGGYAALWGLVKTPKLYQCGISFAGVSDIEMMFSEWSDSNADTEARELMRNRIGNVAASRAQFDAVSPLKHAEKILAPVLLMHGDEDERVPIIHSKKMKSALERYNKPVEWHEFAAEGHGLRKHRSEQTFYRKMLDFLNKHIAPDNPISAEAIKADVGAALPVKQ